MTVTNVHVEMFQVEIVKHKSNSIIKRVTILSTREGLMDTS